MTSNSLNISATISRQTGEAKSKNTLAFCVDENYLPYALFTAEQFIRLHPELPCDICICLPDISKVPEKLKNKQIRFIELSISGIDALPVGRLSLAAYHRLFLPQIFENTYEYIVYLDADTYINKAFYKDLLISIDSFSKNFCVAAAADIMELKVRSHPKERQKKVDLYVKTYHKLNHIYRNSGVLVFNTDNYNKSNILNKIFAYAIDNAESLQCHDQSALNGALLDNIALLPFDFNWQIHKTTYQITDTINPYIIHFISDNKPWKMDNKFTEGYQDYYKIFLEENFPETIPDVLTDYEQRCRTPKYKNPVREFFSIQGHRLKNSADSIQSRLSTLQKNKDNIQNLLTRKPFLVSTDHTTNEDN